MCVYYSNLRDYEELKQQPQKCKEISSKSFELLERSNKVAGSEKKSLALVRRMYINLSATMDESLDAQSQITITRDKINEMEKVLKDHGLDETHKHISFAKMILASRLVAVANGRPELQKAAALAKETLEAYTKEVSGGQTDELHPFLAAHYRVYFSI